MKKMLVFSVMAVLAFSSFALAVPADPDPDGMSVYFDLAATDFCAETVDGVYTPITAYLVVTNPSVDDLYILAWEAQLVVEGNPTVPIPSGWTLTTGAQNFGSGDDYIVGTTSPPLAFTGDATMLGSMTLAFIGYEVGPYATFTVGRVPGSTSFPEGAGYSAAVGFPIPCQHIFGAWGTPCAWVNGAGNCDTVANEEMTWGSVKSLY
jgi:hypothetical protein